MNAHAFLVSLTIVLGVAAVMTLLFQRLKQPVVLGYILAGFIVGPSVPIPLVADREIIQTLSELGVILLMFSLGLEFSLGKLFKLGPTVSLTALLQSTLMVWLGFVTGQAFGWTTTESLFLGAIIAISSTTIIAKAFDEQQVKGSLRELVVGVLIVEDLIAIMLMALLTAVASGTGVSAATMAWTTAKLALFLVTLVGIGLLVVPRGVRAIRRFGRPETTLVSAIGFCFGVSLLAHHFGYSVALGAFIAGSLVAESGEHHEIEHLVQPVRDIFGAVFFVSVGILIDPALIAEHRVAIAVITVVVVVGKVVGVALGAFLTGNSVRTSVQAGMSLAQIGEFSFIIAGLGLSLKATGEFLYPVAVAVSAITTLTTPWMIRAAGPVASFVDRKMPHALQTFVSLYASWIEQLRRGPRDTGRGARIRRLIRLLALDTLVLIGVGVGLGLGGASLRALLQEQLGLEAGVARAVTLGVAVVVALPLVAGLVRVGQRLAIAIAEGALPVTDAGALDLATTPRRAFVATLQLAIVLFNGVVILAATQPFLGGVAGPLVFGVLLVVLGVSLWRGATDLQGHVQAGAETIVAALVTQVRQGRLRPETPTATSPTTLTTPTAPTTAAMTPTTAAAMTSSSSMTTLTTTAANDDVAAPTADDGAPHALAQLHTLLPGIGEPIPFVVDDQCPAVGRSLGQLDLRGVTGATVLAITRSDGSGLLAPGARVVLASGDVLALAGSRDAIDEARAILRQPVAAPTSTPPTTPATPMPAEAPPATTTTNTTTSTTNMTETTTERS